jgi:hypothetical protein
MLAENVGGKEHHLLRHLLYSGAFVHWTDLLVKFTAAGSTHCQMIYPNEDISLSK